MDNYSDRDIFEDFKRNCPWAADEATNFINYGNGEIVVYLKDNSVILYDVVMKTFMCAKNLRELDYRLFPNDQYKWEKEFTNRLYRAIKVKNVTQEDISRLTGIPQSNISRYVRGEIIPSVSNVVKVAKAIDLTEMEFLRLFCYK